MPNSDPTRKRLAIVGGGIAGLAAAHRAQELDPTAEISLFEASDRLGGVLSTIRQDGYLIERSADSFITNLPCAIDLCRRIGFEEQLIPTDAAHRSALVVSRGKLYGVPEGFLLMAPGKLWPLARSPLLSVRGKLRMAWEYFVKARRGGEDESLGAFARRRLGREAFERLVQPLVGGIYTADPEKLSLAATLPRFLEMERQHGGLIRAMRATRQSSSPGDRDGSGARYGLFVAPRDGMSSLVDALAAKLPAGCVQLNSRIERIAYANSRWRLSNNQENLEFDALILATPSPVAAAQLAKVDVALAADLAAIEHAGSAVAVLAYDRGQIAHPLNGFGFVVPAVERRRILSASFSSIKFPGRAPAGKVLIRVFLGGAMQPEMLRLADEELLQIAQEELQQLLGARGNPELKLLFRWHAAMPQYHLGHLERLARINQRLTQIPSLALAGNAYEGVGIPQCIRSGELAAQRVLHTSLTAG